MFLVIIYDHKQFCQKLILHAMTEIYSEQNTAVKSVNSPGFVSTI